MSWKWYLLLSILGIFFNLLYWAIVPNATEPITYTYAMLHGLWLAYFVNKWVKEGKNAD